MLCDWIQIRGEKATKNTRSTPEAVEKNKMTRNNIYMQE